MNKSGKEHAGYRRALIGPYMWLARRFKGRAFVAFPNFLTFLMGSGVKFSYAPETKAYSYRTRGSDVRIYFQHKSRAFSYVKGIRARAEQLGKAYLLNVVDFRPGDVVIDCGANIGEFRYWFEFKGIPVRYIGFEPSPLEYSALKRNCPNDEAYNCGLWNTEGVLDFYVASESADSSLIKPAAFDAIISVPTQRLDKFVSGPVKLFKLEAEGAEPEILEGLGDKLALVEYVAADVSFERGAAMESTLAPVTNYLLARGFVLVQLHTPRLVALYRNTRPLKTVA